MHLSDLLEVGSDFDKLVQGDRGTFQGKGSVTWGLLLGCKNLYQLYALLQ